jgi:hypothetical protein
MHYAESRVQWVAGLCPHSGIGEDVRWSVVAVALAGARATSASWRLEGGQAPRQGIRRRVTTAEQQNSGQQRKQEPRNASDIARMRLWAR